jgi:hypothetical protein
LTISYTRDANGIEHADVAGISAAYHPLEVRELTELINRNMHEEAEHKALNYIALWTDHVERWTQCPAFAAFLRDCSFHRGPYGAARILQRALGVSDSGAISNNDIHQLQQRQTDQPLFLIDLRMAREHYERDICQRDEADVQWPLLINRWSQALDFAHHFCPKPITTPPLFSPPKAQIMSGNYYTNIIQRDHRFHSPDRIDDPMLLEPITRAHVMQIISDARHLGIELMIYETYRSAQRQKELYDQGATKLRFVGVHHYGLACDLVKRVGGQPSWKGDFDFLDHLARKNRLIWGGNWGHPGLSPSFCDDDHVQRIAVPRQTSLFDGSWYPDDQYDPWADLVA